MKALFKLFRMSFFIIIISIINSCSENKTNSQTDTKINIDISKVLSSSENLLTKLRLCN